MPILNKYGVNGGGGGGPQKKKKILGVGGWSAKKSFKFCSDGICINENKTRQNAKASVLNLQKVQIFPGQLALGPPASLCTHHLNFCRLQGGGGGTQKILSN